MNEVCQLNVSDIQETDGIWAMSLNADSEDKSIKTEAGNRTIPHHPKLINLGLLDYVKQIQNQDQEKLFPNLKKMRSTGYGTMISRWFAKYLKKLGIKKKGKNFHSLRHTVVNKLTSKKVYEPFIKELKSTTSSVSSEILNPSSTPDISVICPNESHTGIS